jgi:hypothetical protein
MTIRNCRRCDHPATWRLAGRGSPIGPASPPAASLDPGSSSAAAGWWSTDPAAGWWWPDPAAAEVLVYSGSREAHYALARG